MSKKTWELTVDAEGVISFPADLLNQMGWETGTELSWHVDPDGSILLKLAEFQDDDLDKTEQPA